MIPKVTERYLEVVQKFPPDPSLGEVVAPTASKATKKGIKSLTLYDVKEGKFDEASARVVDFMSNFNDIEGAEWALEVWAKQAEPET